VEVVIFLLCAIKFLVLTVKKRLKSVCICGSYRKIKTAGVSLFWTTLYTPLKACLPANTKYGANCHRLNVNVFCLKRSLNFIFASVQINYVHSVMLVLGPGHVAQVHGLGLGLGLKIQVLGLGLGLESGPWP